MALSPIAGSPRVIEPEPTIETSRTYELFNTQMTSTVDGIEALRQFIRKAILTARSTFTIYGDEYGCELDQLIGENVTGALFDAELTRMIREALIYDDRIASVDNFVIERRGDAVFISFDVATADGIVITEEVTV